MDLGARRFASLYCATMRGGVTVLGIANVTSGYNPFPVVAVLDTPGMAAGIELRTKNNQREMFIGDMRCGLRLYGRGGN
jgi:hypothetical protein